MIQTGEIKNLLATITEINLNNHIKLTAALKKTTLIDKLKQKMKKNFTKSYVKIKKNGEFIDVEIDEEANEVRTRRIEGLMIKDQLIDIFRDTEFRVGN